jgi:hypothetical protein
MNYCVNVEFYDSGTVRGCITCNKKRGKNQYRKVYGMTAIKLWYDNEENAASFLNRCLAKSYTPENFYSVLEDLKKLGFNSLIGEMKRGAA